MTLGALTARWQEATTSFDWASSDARAVRITAARAREGRAPATGGGPLGGGRPQGS